MISSMNLRLSIGIILVAFAIVSCRTSYEPVVNEQELTLLKLGTDYPPLLPPEKAHPVTLKLRASPSHLNASDLEEISNLVGRVPGLLDYNVGLIKDSVLCPGMIEVYVQAMFIIMNKEEQHWRVYRIQPYSV